MKPSDQTVFGRWWLSGPDKPSVLGTLFIDERTPRLVVDVAHDPSDSSAAAGFHAFPPNEPTRTIIHGRDKDDKPVTLFGCGKPSQSVSAGITTHTISVLIALREQELESWDQPYFQTLNVGFDHLHRWLNQPFIERLPGETSRPILQVMAPTEENFELENDIRIGFGQAVLHDSSFDEESIKPRAYIAFYFPTPRSLHEIMDTWVPWAQRLIGLLIGTGVSRTFVRLFKHDIFRQKVPFSEWVGSSAELLEQKTRPQRTLIRDPYFFNMLVPYPKIKDRMQDIVREWHRMDRQLKPVLDLFSAVALHHSLYSSAQFLFLVQALEVYHAISGKFTKGNKPWAQRLQELFEAHQEITTLLFGDVATMAERIANTRNELTHGETRKPRDELLSEEEASRAAWALEALLWIILLRELGIDGEPVKQLLHRVNSAEFVSLNG